MDVLSAFMETDGAAPTVIVTLLVTSPDGEAHVIVYVFDDVRAPVATIPESDFEPVQSPDA